MLWSLWRCTQLFQSSERFHIQPVNKNVKASFTFNFYQQFLLVTSHCFICVCYIRQCYHFHSLYHEKYYKVDVATSTVYRAMLLVCTISLTWTKYLNTIQYKTRQRYVWCVWVLEFKEITFMYLCWNKFDGDVQVSCIFFIIGAMLSHCSFPGNVF